MPILALRAAMAAIIATSVMAQQTPSLTARPGVRLPELARVIKTDLESIAGPGTVEVSVNNPTLIRVRIALSTFSSEICTPIYDRERELYRLFPDLNLDFYFDGPALARAIKTDLESISGTGNVDVSIDHETLFSVRIGVPSFSSDIYTRIYDRELELYRLFGDLNFDFYLRIQGL
jgi:copper chaperone CopZ